MFSIIDSLKNDIVCQRRTGRNKQFVILKKDDEDYVVIKGPYTDTRLETYCERVEIIRLLGRDYKSGGHLVIPILEDNKVKIINSEDKLHHTKNNQYILFDNLITEKIETESDIHKESFSDYQYNVLLRSGLLKFTAQRKRS